MRFLKLFLHAALVAALALSFTACDETFFDDEGDCDVHYLIRFRYERNLKWADAFPSEVNSVNLYVFDGNGLFVKEYKGRGEALSSPDYSIELDLPAGDYKFLGWCGLENDGVEMESFTVPQPVAGVTTIDELTCALNTKRAAARAAIAENGVYSDEQLHFLYHGYLEETLVDGQDGQWYEYVMYLTKDTNHIRIILQETTGEGLNVEDYEITIEDDNSLMAYDNSLIGNGTVTYRPWAQEADELGVGKPEADGPLQYVRGVYADLTVGRLMASHQDDLMLTIRNKATQEIIARVPVLQYALLSRKYYEEAYGHRMDDQEFLDREDEYVLTFFLVNHKWIDSMIMIHSWRIVRHDYDVGY